MPTLIIATIKTMCNCDMMHVEIIIYKHITLKLKRSYCNKIQKFSI